MSKFGFPEDRGIGNRVGGFIGNTPSVVSGTFGLRSQYKYADIWPIAIAGLYNFTSFTFTNGTQTGSEGPSLQNLLDAYDTNENPWLENTEFFNTSDGIQLWTVPADGTYRIKAFGAAGGPNSNAIPGFGAIIQADIFLNAGQILEVLVGQRGLDSSGGTTGSTNSSGAGGGTFVVVEENNTKFPVIVAGGGGGPGADSSPASDGINANTGTSGTKDREGIGGEGINGQGGQAGLSSGNTGGGGGGFLTDGQNSGFSGAGDNVPGFAYINGGAGAAQIGRGHGGFGGGSKAGISNDNCPSGGGGGYSGGAGGNRLSSTTFGSARIGGGGGGSFIIEGATNVATSDGNWTITGNEPHAVYSGSATNLNEYNDGHGKVEITFLG